MKNRKHLFLSAFVSVFLSFSLQTYCAHAQDFTCQPGEKLTYSIGYKVAGIYIKAGSARFSVDKPEQPSGTIYHFTGEGSTNSAYDWIFKVRDRYESYFDIITMHPVKAIRNVNEGKYKKHEEVVFDLQNKVAVTNKGPVKIPEAVQDVISSVYYMRSLDFKKYKKGDKIPFNMFFGHEVYNLYVQYIGNEIIRTDYGTLNSIKLQPMLLKGDVFKNEDDMEIWITNDSNHIPLRIESKLKVGSIKVDLSSYENLKYPLVANKGK